MKAVVQRVSRAYVTSEGKPASEIEKGITVLLGVCEGDTSAEAQLLARKCANLRIFDDSEGKMNLSMLDVGGEALVVSNFTLCADTKKGNRPSYTGAMEPARANELYTEFCENMRSLGVKKVGTGVFRTEMEVGIINDGPITIILDTDTWSKK